MRLCTTLAVFVAMLYAATAEKVDMKRVIPLGDADFNTVTVDGQWFIMFYAPWCGHCKRLKPIFANISETAPCTEGKITLAMVDCTTWKHTCDENHIKGYPGLRYKRGNGPLVEYKGEREEPAMQAFIARLLETGTTDIDSPDALASFTKPETPSVRFVFFFPGAADKHLVNEIHFKTASFPIGVGVCESAPSKCQMTVKEPTIRLYNDVDSASVSYSALDGPWTADDISQWIDSNRFLVIEELSHTNFYAMGHRGKRMAILVYNKPAESAGHFQKDHGLAELRLVASAQRYRDQFVFGRLDGIYWVRWIDQFGYKAAQFPYFFVYDGAEEFHYDDPSRAEAISKAIVHGEAQAAAELVKAFLDDVTAGKLPRRANGFSGLLRLWLAIALEKIEDFGYIPSGLVALALLGLLAVLLYYALPGGPPEKKTQ
eukprot:TRINITY_DN21999_c0_g1_i2.p2 TRINITY_DN21999_c0_g1~~TRINITY_DN21999_c0_g1_i2.p2  ORF type:complete len:430 (+),score=81.18 TRINITY_DN21999_c0_g1_i2:1718-3007(+)